MTDLPETVLQFGTGRFLRAFADFFIHEANVAGQNVGRVVVVQSTGAARAEGLNAQSNGYHVAVRGVENEQVVDRVVRIESIARALHAGTQWVEVLRVAAIGAWLGPAQVATVALATSVVGGVIAIVVALAHGYLREALTNLYLVVMHWRISGVRPLPAVTLEKVTGPRLAYAVPIAIGTVVTLWLK